MSKRPNPHSLKAAISTMHRQAKKGKPIGMGRPTALATQRRTPIQEIGLDDRLQQFQRLGTIEKDCRRFRFGDGIVMVGRSETNGWHLSISFPDRYPSWDEVAEARYRLIPDEATMAMILPPQAEYVNLHPTCLHLYEVAQVSLLNEAHATIRRLTKPTVEPTTPLDKTP